MIFIYILLGVVVLLLAYVGICWWILKTSPVCWLCGKVHNVEYSDEYEFLNTSLKNK